MKHFLLCILLEIVDPHHRFARPRPAREPLVWPTIDPSLLPEKPGA